MLLGREIGRDEHVVGYTGSHLSDGGGCGRSYHHKIGPEPEVYMAMPFPAVGREKLANHRPPAQRRQCHRSDELLSRRGDHYLHLGAALH